MMYFKFVNHAQCGNLELFSDADKLVVDFVAGTDIAEGDELSFDYGIGYWLYRPAPEGDRRNFSDPRYRQRPPELALLHPPPVGTVLPLTPLTALELQAALAGQGPGRWVVVPNRGGGEGATWCSCCPTPAQIAECAKQS